ncbi:hypothetical protein RNAN_2638 [Rheinheimera nanhaiensis E407-8]|uniref:Uncharacterized protein n=1 Tax=Rheinheimera nanhaiensis E407-8 TaxID=562729 RepID=I1E004_9GAMM|nr:hypothetical protein RNAN_2638 [Rheinheimera nanhaiensis E407-8]
MLTIGVLCFSAACLNMISIEAFLHPCYCAAKILKKDVL